MPLFTPEPVQHVYSILWVDQNSTIETEDGTLERPYKTVQAAIDHGVNAGTPNWNLQLAFGDYSSETLTIPPNMDFVFEGRVRRSNMKLGPINWTVTGNSTSLMAFRRLVVGPLTIIDGVSPATLVRLSYVDCECQGVEVTGASFVTIAMGGATLANVDPSVSPVVASIVTGDVDLNTGTLLSQNSQFQAGCSLIRVGNLLAGNNSFSQDIEVTGIIVQISDSIWSTAHTITFTGVSGTAILDASSTANFEDLGSSVVNGEFIVFDQRATGWISGGLVTRDTGLAVDVTAGSGYVFQFNDRTTFVHWSNSNISLPANQLVDIFVDADGIVQSGVHPVNQRSAILLATAFTSGSDIIALSAERTETTQIVPQLSDYALKIAGSIHVSGVATTIHAAPSLQLAVDSGSYYNGIHLNTVSASAPITFTYWYRDGLSWFTIVSGQTAIDPNFWDDGSGTLAALSAGQWKKDLLFVSKNDDGTEYHVVYGQEVFTSQSEAEAGNLPVAPDALLATGLRLAGVVVEGAATDISSTTDERPRIGQLASGSTAVTDHGLLSGLSDDDHLQYLLVDGSRSMSGDLNMGTNDVLNVGLVDGVDVSSHATRHLPSGADALSVGTPVTIGTTNTDGIANSFSRSDHQHAHGAQTDPALHAIVTTIDNGFMSAPDKVKLDHLPFGWAQYSNSANNTTTSAPTTFAALVIDTDFDSFHNSLFTKLSTTQIRTDFAGYVRVSFKVEAQIDVNDRPFRAVVVKNGSELPRTSARNIGKTNANRYSSVSGSFIIPCAVNDTFSLGFGNAEGTDTVTIFAGQGVFSVQAIYRN